MLGFDGGALASIAIRCTGIAPNERGRPARIGGQARSADVARQSFRRCGASSALIAFRIRSRWPPIEMPMSFSIWSSTWPSKSIPISLASKASAYWPTPISSRHLRISLMP
jgi:hypothetical protein